MKTFSKALLLTLLFAFQLAQAQSDADKPLIVQRNSTDTAYVNRILPIPAGAANGIFYFDGSTVRPRIMTLGTNLAIVADVLNASSAAQVNSDWNAVSGAAQILNKPTLFNGVYSSLTGIPSTFTPAAHTQAFSTITATPTTLTGYGITDAYPLTGNPSAFLTSITSGQIATALGFTPYDSSNPSAYINQAGARSAISLTTTGTSGASTYSSSTGILNVPQYANSGGTVTSVTAGTGLSGGVITTTGTVSMPNTGTAGTYSGVTTDAQGRVTSGTTLSINDAPGRALVTSTASTGFQVSSTRPAYVCYEGAMQTTSTIGGPSSGSIFIETANTNSTTPGDWTKIAEQTSSNTITLAIVLQSVDGEPWSLCRMVTTAKYVRIRSQIGSGTVSFTINTTQQEVLM